MPARLFENDNNILHINYSRMFSEHSNFEFYHFTTHRYSFMSMCVYLLDAKINSTIPATHFSHLSISFIHSLVITNAKRFDHSMLTQTNDFQTNEHNHLFYFIFTVIMLSGWQKYIIDAVNVSYPIGDLMISRSRKSIKASTKHSISEYKSLHNSSIIAFREPF